MANHLVLEAALRYLAWHQEPTRQLMVGHKKNLFPSRVMPPWESPQDEHLQRRRSTNTQPDEALSNLPGAGHGPETFRGLSPTKPS